MKKIVTILSALFISVGCFVGMSGHELVGYADQKDYVLTLNSTNGAIKAASYQGSIAKSSAKTKQNNIIDFESIYGLTRTNELGQLKDDGTAYYRNITPITGIYKIDVNYAFSGSSGKCYLSLGSQNGTSFVEAEEFAFDASKGANVYSTQTFTNFKTDYSHFKIHRETDSNRAIYIKNIDIYYYCNGVPSTPTTPTVSVSEVTVTPETISIEKGNTFGLTNEVLPTDASDKSVTWSSNNTNVATVNELGVVAGVGKGSATITCTTNDGGFTDTCLVTVTEKEVVTTTSYKLVEGANQLVDGTKVALVSRSSGKIAGPVSSQYLTSVSFDTLTSDTTEFENIPSGALELTLEKSGTSWKFKNSSDQYLGATAVKKIAFGQGTTTWSISISSGSATIQNATSSYGRFLYNVSSPRFTTYASATSATMLLPELFIQTTTEGGEEEPDTPVVPEEPVVTLSSLEASLTKDTYKVGDTFDKNSVTIAGIMSDGSTQNYTFNDIDEYTCYDEDLNDINLDSPLATEGEYVLTVTIDDVESDTLSFYVEAEEVVPSGSTATITIGSSSSTSNDLGDNAIDCLTVNGVTISSVSGSKIFGLGSSTPGFKLGSGSATGTITFNFSNEIVISGISLKIGRYNSKSSSVKVSTSANTTGETISLGSDEYISSPYVCSNFTSNTVASKSLTIATASSSSDKRFQLYEITLTIGVAQKVDVTGVNISQESLSIGVGSTFQLSANVLPTNASNKIVTWSTSSSNIASISNTGIVSGVAVGTATISVKTEEGGFTDNVTVTVTQVAYDSYYKATTVDPDFNYKDIQESQDCSSIPAGSGDRNILVVPVELTDYEFTQETLDDIEIAFNGDSSNTYWESVASFYEKSSYGKMHLNFEIADVYESGMSAKTMSRIEVDEQNYFYFTQHVVEDVIDDYKTKNGNSSTKQFDSDSDGFIDAVWMIYSCPNYSNESGLSDEYWAYVYWNNWNESASFSSPVAGAYGWASYDFMYEKGDTKIDAHTYIHETGHLFGLDDYYNYDKGRTSLGGVDMMDFNVIDHNSWSKMALGWTKPYIVTGNAEITISAAVDSGDCILIPDATSGWNGTSFDEFILLELYSPTGLNAKDATTSYNSANVYTQPGIRLYHVDSRLARYAYSSSKGWQFSTYIEPSGFVPGTYYYYCPAASNTPSYSENEDYELIHMIQAGGTDTFSYGGSANNSDLFKTGQTFSMSAYGSKFFANGTKFNNGNDFGYTITFVSVSSTSATIRITKA